MAKLTAIAIDKAGIDLDSALVAAEAGGDSTDAASGVFVAVKNVNASARTVTVTAPVASANCPGFGSVPVSDLVITVAQNETQCFAVPSGYTVANEIAWTYDDETDVTVGVLIAAP